MKLYDIKVFPIDNEDLFEDFCLDLYKIYFADPNTQKNGRRGQRQDGVDVFCHEGIPFKWIGIQCKVRNGDNKLSLVEINAEISKAKKFNPKISNYIIATTCSRDSVIQENIRIINEDHQKQGIFCIKIDFWEDIVSYLCDTKYEYVIFKYYSEFIIDSLKQGFSVGKLFSIITGIDKKYDTRHQMLIAKIPLFDPDRKKDISYFQDRYVVLDMNSRKFSIIQDQCFPLDFEQSINSGLDREIISRWLREVDKMELIYSDQYLYYYSISK